MSWQQRPPAGAARLDLEDLGLDRGGHLLLRRALAALPPGESLEVCGRDPHLAHHLRAWCRAEGHELLAPDRVRPRQAAPALLSTGATHPVDLAARADPRWGLAARGAQVEAGSPALPFRLSERDALWTEDAARLYAQAAAAQWDPATAIPWSTPLEHPDEVEDAVVQIMTYLVENETAALLVPARFLGQVHPYFREIVQLLAIQVADEARHVEVFTRRAALARSTLGLSTAGGQASLQSLLDEPDFALAMFLLSVLGEGSFLDLLWFLEQHGPDPITRAVARLAAQDEARHVAFGMAHLQRHAEREPTLRARLAAAVHRRHAALQHTAGLNGAVFDALVLLAAGSFRPADVAQGWDRVAALVARMDQGRRVRLRRLGFDEADAAALSGLHTRNFM